MVRQPSRSAPRTLMTTGGAEVPKTCWMICSPLSMVSSNWGRFSAYWRSSVIVWAVDRERFCLRRTWIFARFIPASSINWAAWSSLMPMVENTAATLGLETNHFSNREAACPVASRVVPTGSNSLTVNSPWSTSGMSWRFIRMAATKPVTKMINTAIKNFFRLFNVQTNSRW